jgi:hypothetical protein
MRVRKVAAVNQLITRGIEETGGPRDWLGRMMGHCTSESNVTGDCSSIESCGPFAFQVSDAFSISTADRVVVFGERQQLRCGRSDHIQCLSDSPTPVLRELHHHRVS